MLLQTVRIRRGHVTAAFELISKRSDISRDDGKTWQPLNDGNWNALSMPFIVVLKGESAGSAPILKNGEGETSLRRSDSRR